MRIVVIATGEQYAEWITSGVTEGTEVLHLTDVDQLEDDRTDGIIDLDFRPEAERIEALLALGHPVLVNSVERTLDELHPDLVRINGWKGFLASALVEATAAPAQQEEATRVLAAFGKQVEWLPDTPGFVSARVIAMIINEARLALAEGVSSREDMDTAMKLGTNYPQGPFEWEASIGVDKVDALLRRLGH